MATAIATKLEFSKLLDNMLSCNDYYAKLFVNNLDENKYNVNNSIKI